MVVNGCVEVLAARTVAVLVVLAHFDVEVGDPAELAVDVPLGGALGPVREPGALQFVVFVGVWLAARRMPNDFLVAERLVEQLLKDRNEGYCIRRT